MRTTPALLVLGVLLVDVAWRARKRHLRDTIETCRARQRGILHVEIGHEGWDPTEKEMHEVGALFRSADLDPAGGMVMTRHGVRAQRL